MAGKVARARPSGPETPAWPADKVERWPLDRLVPYARNARTHSEEQVAQIAAAIREWGWTNPILVDEAGGIIAGHGRVLAARTLGIDRVPVMVAAGWSEAQKRAYILADNKLAENAGWDRELLRLEVADLDAMGFDLALTGFSEADLRTISAPPNEPDTSSRMAGLEYRIIVDCEDEAEQTELLDRFEREGLKCRALIS